MSTARQSSFRTSFQFQLFRLFTVLTAVITVAFAALFAASDLRKSRLFAEEMLQSQAMGFAEAIRLPLYAENREALVQSAEEILRLPQIRGVEIRSADGRVLVRLPARLPQADRLLSRGAQVATRLALPSLPQVMEPASDPGKNVIGSVRLYRGTDDLTLAARKLLVATVALALLFWLLVSYSCYRLLQRVTHSFQGLMSGLKRVHAGEYGTRIEVLSDDEPGRASVAVNELAESLRRRAEENSRLNAELREAMDVEIASKTQLVALNESLEAEIEKSRRARQELKSLVEQLPVGIIWSDAEGAVEYLNAFMRERFGYPPEEITTVYHWFEKAMPDAAYRDTILGMRRAAIAAGKAASGAATSWDARVIGRDGSVREISFGIQLSGERVVDIVLDMTEREQLQQQIIRNQKLESLGVLAGGIAHNFNNALTGVLGFISFARQFLDSSHRAYPLLCHAERASTRAAGVAKQLLTFAKGGDPNRKAVAVEKLVREAVLLATSGSRVVNRLELPATLDAVHADEDQISQAFNCLCINAVQAMPDGGVLTVRARNVSTREGNLPVSGSVDYVEISFEDQGSGISEKDRAKIFTPYFTTKAEIGTGLGLATVHSIVTRHEGAISFVSTVGAGTTFTIYLPSSKHPAPEQGGHAKETVPQPGAPGASVLVMDDEEVIRTLAHEVLEHKGYRVTSCITGEEAIQRYREAYDSGSPYLAAILDLTVPGGIGGEEVARQILAIDPVASLILSSGHTEDSVVREFKEHGFCATAAKPYDAGEIVRILNQIRMAGAD